MRYVDFPILLEAEIYVVRTYFIVAGAARRGGPPEGWKPGGQNMFFRACFSFFIHMGDVKKRKKSPPPPRGGGNAEQHDFQDFIFHDQIVICDV